jgi:CRP-like cAMP-binding protein
MAKAPTGDHGGNWLLAALEPEVLASFEPQLEKMDLPAGQVLYEAGEEVRYAYFPQDAMISLVTILQDGGVVEMGVFGREGVIGFVGAVTNRRAFGRYLVQLPGSASRMPVTALQEAFDTHPGVRSLFMRYIEVLLEQTFQIVACNAVHGVEARCCRWILTTQDRVGKSDLPLTHEFLAEMLGVQRPTVSIVTRTLQTAGLITQRRGGITVVDRAGLEDAACECHAKIRRCFEHIRSQSYGSRGSHQAAEPATR